MKKTKFFIFLLITLVSVSFFACSPSSESVPENKEEPKEVKKEEVTVIVPEPVQKETETKAPEVQNPKVKYYLVQIGAYTTEERAVEFKKLASEKIDFKIYIEYNSNTGLYSVIVNERFTDKTDAVNLRNRLWDLKTFKDAFIIDVFD